MPDILKPDLCVIGAGSGGLSVAAAARAFGASVVLIERARMGGDCLNTGCVPSKSLIAAARYARAGRDAAVFGVAYEEPKVNFGRVHAHIEDVIAGIAPHDSVERYRAMGVEVIEAGARFIDRRTVEAGGQRVRARRFIIATGSRPAIPPIPGIDAAPYLTNETVFSLTRKPGHLVVIGGGPVGIELAQAFRGLGCEVTVVEVAEPLAKDDPELTAIALRRLAEEGVTVHARTGVTAVAPQGQGIAVTLRHADGREETVTGSHLLVAAGRRPNMEDLDLEVAKIRYNERGLIVGPNMRTSNRRVFGVGDVAGGQQFTHVANYQASLVVRAAVLGLPARENRDIIPRVTYTVPEIAQVGLTESEARARLGDGFRVVRWPFAENDRARTGRQTEGLVKLIADRKGRILGCGIVGADAGELISLFSFALANKLKVRHLAAFIAPYPTLAEAARRVGIEYYREALSSPWLARWVNFVRKWP